MSSSAQLRRDAILDAGDAVRLDLGGTCSLCPRPLGTGGRILIAVMGRVMHSDCHEKALGDRAAEESAFVSELGVDPAGPVGRSLAEARRLAADLLVESRASPLGAFTFSLSTERGNAIRAGDFDVLAVEGVEAVDFCTRVGTCSLDYSAVGARALLGLTANLHNGRNAGDSYFLRGVAERARGSDSGPVAVFLNVPGEEEGHRPVLLTVHARAAPHLVQLVEESGLKAAGLDAHEPARVYASALADAKATAERVAAAVAEDLFLLVSRAVRAQGPGFQPDLLGTNGHKWPEMPGEWAPTLSSVVRSTARGGASNGRPIGCLRVQARGVGGSYNSYLPRYAAVTVADLSRANPDPYAAARPIRVTPSKFSQTVVPLLLAPDVGPEQADGGGVRWDDAYPDEAASLAASDGYAPAPAGAP